METLLHRPRRSRNTDKTDVINIAVLKQRIEITRLPSITPTLPPDYPATRFERLRIENNGEYSITSDLRYPILHRGDMFPIKSRAWKSYRVSRSNRIPSRLTDHMKQRFVIRCKRLKNTRFRFKKTELRMQYTYAACPISETFFREGRDSARNLSFLRYAPR